MNLDTETLRPLKNKVLVHNLEQGEKMTSGGIILLDDNGKERGITSRWGIIYKVGPEIDYLQEGDWVLIEHGRWSRGVDLKDSNGKTVTTIRQVDPDCIMLKATEPPSHIKQYENAKLHKRNVHVKELDKICDEEIDDYFIEQVNNNVKGIGLT
jgi:co-chaperonin GroES (HSP10)